MIHSLKSQENKHCPQSTIGEKKEDILLIITLAQKNVGSADQLHISELNVANTNEGGKKKKRRLAEKENALTDIMKELMTTEETEEMMTDTAMTVVEIKRIPKENGKVIATNPLQLKNSRNHQGGTQTPVLLST